MGPERDRDRELPYGKMAAWGMAASAVVTVAVVLFAPLSPLRVVGQGLGVVRGLEARATAMASGAPGEALRPGAEVSIHLRRELGRELHRELRHELGRELRLELRRELNGELGAMLVRNLDAELRGQLVPALDAWISAGTRAAAAPGVTVGL